MKWVLYYQSLLSDWNNGHAHFLRGVVRELRRRGHTVEVWEPRDGSSRRQLCRSQGEAALTEVAQLLDLEGCSRLYDPHDFKVDPILAEADVTIVHEGTDPGVIEAVAAWRRAHATPDQVVLFHDTNHRAVSAPETMPGDALRDFDTVLVFGESLRRIYLERGWAAPARVWHEAADTTWFKPPEKPPSERDDLIWIGNWGDGERRAEMEEFLLAPARELKLDGCAYGVGYPEDARHAIASTDLEYGGWLANHRAPEACGRYRMTVHLPRRYYRELLPGIPTIRVFEALACGIPLISAPWEDTEELFTPGEDFILVDNGTEMRDAMHAVRTDPDLANRLCRQGLETIARRHTCVHRVDELESIVRSLGLGLDAPIYREKPPQPANQVVDPPAV